MPPSCYCTLLNKKKSSETAKKGILPTTKMVNHVKSTVYDPLPVKESFGPSPLPRSAPNLWLCWWQRRRARQQHQCHKHGHCSRRQSLVMRCLLAEPHHEMPPGSLSSPSGHGRVWARTLTSGTGQHGRRWEL